MHGLVFLYSPHPRPLTLANSVRTARGAIRERRFHPLSPLAGELARTERGKHPKDAGVRGTKAHP
jgi:hypothetical protein